MFNATTKGKQMYKYQVNFEKVFVSGALIGKRYHDHIRFTDWKSADAYAKREGEVFKAYGGMDYRMECPQVIALEPTTAAKGEITLRPRPRF
jgi:hypothetical protein